tara:strand:+ start:597 stop:1310 length:714 start_codon:yes stop_codon:yes gene_type:complete
MEKNKTGKYLKYAIGEIILVVIGILIALSINNWNEKRKLFSNEQSLFKKLITDLDSEKNLLKSELNYLKRHQDLHYHIYKKTKGALKNDTINSYNRLQWIIIYHPKIKENYAKLLEKISNDSIRDLLSQYIWREESTLDAFEEFNDYKLQYLRPYFSKHGILNTALAFNDTPYEFMSLDNIELINHEKLEEQYGSQELDQILFNLRFKTAWQIDNINRLDALNKKLKLVLIEEIAKN